MKKLFVSILAIALTITINAQKIPGEHHRGFNHHPGKMKHHRGMMMKGIDLTEGQKQQIKTENEGFRKQMEELKKNENITVKEWKGKMQKLREDHKTKMQGVLTPDQKVQLEKQKAEMKTRHEGMVKERTEKMKTRLGLCSEQSMNMDKSMEEMKIKMNSLKENKSLSHEQKKEQYMELRKQQKEKMKSILTEDQLKQLKERKPGKRRVT